MATLTIKNIPDKLRRRLKESAAQHGHSINGEAIFCLEKVLVGDRMDPHEFPARALSLRERMPRVFLTEKELRAARRASGASV
jgi:plasmid stability protein